MLIWLLHTYSTFALVCEVQRNPVSQNKPGFWDVLDKLAIYCNFRSSEEGSPSGKVRHKQPALSGVAAER